MTGDAELIVGQAGGTDKFCRWAAALHLLPIKIRTVGEVAHREFFLDDPQY
jgi:hypothetical protein